MSQSVTYADLRFEKLPLEKIQRRETIEELTYENVQGPSPEEGKAPSSSEPGKGPSRQKYYAAVALLGTFLFFFATTVGFAVCYWQVSRQLREASQAHAANSSALAQRIRTERESLALAQEMLREAEAGLKRAGEELRGAQSNLTLLQKDQERLEEENREVEANLTDARSCQQIGCCPPQWKLFRWKCLWVSTEQKTWVESCRDCVMKESRLLTLKDPRTPEEMKTAQVLTDFLLSTSLWTGMKKMRGAWVGFEELLFPRNQKCDLNVCMRMIGGSLSVKSCSMPYRYICEKAAQPSPWP